MNGKTVIKRIIKVCEEYGVKVSVISTATVFFRKIEKNYKDTENMENDMQPDDHGSKAREKLDIFSDEFLVGLIAVACKSNDIVMPSRIRKGYMPEKIAMMESTIPTLFGFKMHIPCPFTRMLGLIICLCEHKIVELNVSSMFEKGAGNIKRILLDDNYMDYSVNEVAAAALPIDCKYLSKLMVGELSCENIEKIRKNNNVTVDCQ
ncbi:hypothetical protein VCUG_00462 [Vavraia culicis subsp. floridensis]|uniref:Uncharacterized protein n=1 Tax=Vavraia culicis (isolate floridensis) TaxID=948595 RepID=L2GWN5_VAVCU|nr:uncharacterized protein VCUG_00462 [Vavraia culicis subsp. floridensis]ELA48039.1 hypothetical protein VCUG_00462 [Vavraia culicis subsp. floridensis]